MHTIRDISRALCIIRKTWGGQRSWTCWADHSALPSGQKSSIIMTDLIKGVISPSSPGKKKHVRDGQQVGTARIETLSYCSSFTIDHLFPPPHSPTESSSVRVFIISLCPPPRLIHTAHAEVTLTLALKNR